MPALMGRHSSASGKTFESEREILYQILFDLRRDMTELKKLVHSNLGQMKAQPMETASEQLAYYPAETVHYPTEMTSPTLNLHGAPTPANKVVMDDDIQDTEEYVEESLSLDDLEREMIRKALDKHRGKRKYAAQDLNISERTLYRKIKEYGLD